MRKLFRHGILSALFLLLASCESTRTGPVGRTIDSTERYSAPSNEFRGAWVYDPRKFEPEEVVRNLKRAGFNAVFVRLSSAGSAYYPSKVLPKAPGTYRDYAQEYVDAGRKYDVQVHAWHVCFMMHYAPSRESEAAIKKGEVMRNSKGAALRPTYGVPVRTPALASNRQLELKAMTELVNQYALNGVQFDYIRYFSPGVDYSATAREAFEKEIGKKIKNWPSDVMKGSMRDKYHEWKAGLVTSVVRECSRAVKASRSSAKVSAAVWYSPEIAYKDYAQDWVHWVREGYLDFVVPMNYTPHTDKLQEWVDHQKELINGRIPLYSGIGAYMMHRSSQLNSQINLCRKMRLPGYVLYNYDEALKEGFLSEIAN